LIPVMHDSFLFVLELRVTLFMAQQEHFSASGKGWLDVTVKSQTKWPK
jgi:hypothetical protein